MNNFTEKIKSISTAISGKIESQLTRRPFVSCLIMGFVMNLLIYFLNARSLVGGVENIYSNFGYFLFNSLILITFYSVSLFFARRLFVITFITLAWLALGVTNFILLGMRDNPLEAIDFRIIRTGFAIITIYLNVFQIILYSLLVLTAVALLVLLFIKCPKIRPKYSYALLVLICCVLILSLVGFAVIPLNKTNRENITADHIGFPYFFLCSVFDRGIDKPSDYSENKVEEILKDLDIRISPTDPRTPNIIFVQLESFFDVNRIEGIEFSKDPIPNFTALSEKGGSGLFAVKSVGSGTANTEFEVLSGLDLEFFGTGEYPYTSVLGEHCCETIAYDLSELGYSAHAMHNHTATFYDRFEVYGHLGFDSFTALEYMKNVEYNAIGWEKDKILSEYIFKALKSTKEPDFVFAVSVQGHGRYPNIPTDAQQYVTVSNIDEERFYEMEFYVNQLHEMDMFIGELYEAIMAYDEEIVLVLYGDHLPALKINKEELENQNLLQTDYVIVSNFGLEIEDRDINAYELFPTVLKSLGISNGLVNKIHSTYSDHEHFEQILKLIGYDMLYGNRIAYNGDYPYTPTNLTLGLDRIHITKIDKDEEGFLVYGENFTPFSNIELNGRKIATEFIDEGCLKTENKNLDGGDKITVVQISDDLRKLSESDIYIFTQ